MFLASPVNSVLVYCVTYMISTIRFSALLLIGILINREATAQRSKEMVRLASIRVDSTRLGSYRSFLEEEIAVSIQKEAGVLTLCAVSEKQHPENILIFETYADSGSYRSHIKTAHFLKYKTGTASMVSDLKLTDVNPVFLGRNAKQPGANPFIRVVQLEIESSMLAEYPAALETILRTSTNDEPGVWLMYGVQEKSDPTRFWILEAYESDTAARKHLHTQPYRAYKKATRKMIKSRRVINTSSVHLGLRG